MLSTADGERSNTRYDTSPWARACASKAATPARGTRKLTPMACGASGCCSHQRVVSASLGAVNSAPARNAPCTACSACNGVASRASTAPASAVASRMKVARSRSSSQRPTATVASTSKPLAASMGSATVRVRVAQALRGRPISVSATGAPISTPSVSPIHQINMLSANCSVPTVPASQSALLPSTALVTHAPAAPSRPNRTMSRGSAKIRGWATKRCASAAPSAACKAAPTPMANGNVSVVTSNTPRSATTATLTTKAPNTTPASAHRPYTSTAASAMPAEG